MVCVQIRFGQGVSEYAFFKIGGLLLRVALSLLHIMHGHGEVAGLLHLLKGEVNVKVGKLQPLRSKWVKTKVILNNSFIKPFIPDTQRYNKANLKSMISKYGMVYIKPESGTYGMGVIKAEKVNPQSFAYQIEQKRLTFDNFESFHASLERLVRKKSYLVQKGIHLLKHNNRRFDIRVMIQLNPSHQWEATGIIGRLGHPKKIVTNYHSGGKPMDVHKLLESHASPKRRKELVREMNELSLHIARHMKKKYPHLKQIGVDIGLDRGMKPWIIEVNVKPDPFIFNQLKDKTMYRRVRQCYRRAASKVK
ncbi:YheC/YheD family protein [Paenibacillus sp. FSL M7-0831]|uniref:YheC/YheD family protein n=1 Tax=Paenibacillus macerans TaxID=44252 RepID=UPI000AC7BB8D|nr:YheC/YheD family protein [Paenibacillus macerans]MEC0329497.1 YheC/YheD family protein [Paenibacillus macerans]